jgi:RNase P/RNase MRP subunit p30
MSPRNETVFSAICNTAHLLYVDIITLDYTAGRGGVQLPYTIKSSSIATAISHGLYFEIPYGPAIMDTNKRKAFVQTAKQFQLAIMAKSSSSSTFPMVLSSGNRRRMNGDKDMGPMALRLPGDLQNFIQVVLGLSNTMAGKWMRYNAQRVVDRERKWKMDSNKSTEKLVAYEKEWELEEDMAKRKNDEIEGRETYKKPKHDVDEDKDDDDMDDGFIRF